MKNKPLVSIIIRTKNEERWINSCLDSIYNQTYKNFEIILVDNLSSDKTVEKAKQKSVKKIVFIKNYLPGKALNLGIEKSEGKFIVCLSAHCIPVNSVWLNNLVKAIEEDKTYAGVYGRQEPMSFSTDSDKRDLMLVFGLDRKIQIKDSFFHNANSIIRKECWDKKNFDSKITNIEDRIWAKEMLKLNYKILYEPSARVSHFHGIHQNGNQERLTNVVNIIQNELPIENNSYDVAKKLKIIAVVPVRGDTISINGKPLLCFTLDNAKKSKFLDKIFVSTDSQYTSQIAKENGAECPFIRPSDYSLPHVNLETVQKYSLEMIEKNNYFPDLIVHLQETFPFRHDQLIDDMILSLLENGYDSVIASKREPGWIWKESENGDFQRIDSGDIPRDFKQSSFIGLHGCGCVTYPEYIRNNKILGNKIGMLKVKHPLAAFEIRNEEQSKVLSNHLNNLYI